MAHYKENERKRNKYYLKDLEPRNSSLEDQIIKKIKLKGLELIHPWLELALAWHAFISLAWRTAKPTRFGSKPAIFEWQKKCFRVLLFELAWSSNRADCLKSIVTWFSYLPFEPVQSPNRVGYLRLIEAPFFKSIDRARPT